MVDFIKSIFETPTVLWTIGQELFVAGAVIVLLLIGVVIIYVGAVIYEKIKYRHCSLKSVTKCKSFNCDTCKWSNKNREADKNEQNK